MSSPSHLAIHAYRDLLRSMRIAFRGDTRLLTSAHAQARHAFEAHRTSAEYEEKVRHAREVARLLRENVVQGVSAGKGEGDMYQLRIHDYTERGDNDSVKKAGKGMSAPMMGGCCRGAAAVGR